MNPVKFVKENMILSTLALLVGVLAPCCESPYEFEMDYGEFVVVDGKLSTDGSRVIVSYSGGYNPDSTALRPINDAEVMVEDFSGREHPFTNTSGNNVYLPEAEFTPVSGQQYILSVKVGEKTIYSRPETLNPSVPFTLSAVYAERTILSASNNAEQVSGHNIIVGFPDGLPEGSFLKWKYEANWEHPYTYIDYKELTGGYFNVTSGEVFSKADASDFEVYFQQNRHQTYSEPFGFMIDVNDLETDDYIGTLTQSNQHEIIDSLTVINNTTPVKKYLYTIRVIQSSLSEKAYDYWSSILTQKENTGDIFDALPARISGNLFIPNSNEVVLGYFSVEEVAKQEYVITYLMDRIR